MTAQPLAAIDAPVTALEAKLIACRRIFAACEAWGLAGREMVLRGEFDDEPEMVRLMAAFEEGKRNV